MHAQMCHAVVEAIAWLYNDNGDNSVEYARLRICDDVAWDSVRVVVRLTLFSVFFSAQHLPHNVRKPQDVLAGRRFFAVVFDLCFVNAGPVVSRLSTE